jgi:hypothetical protein
MSYTSRTAWTDSSQPGQRGLWLIALFAAVLLTSCQWGAPRVRRLDFGPLAQADRVLVIGSGGVVLDTLKDSARVKAAADYIEGKHDGWTESWRGPTAGVAETRLLQASHVSRRVPGVSHLHRGRHLSPGRGEGRNESAHGQTRPAVAVTRGGPWTAARVRGPRAAARRARFPPRRGPEDP